MVPRRVRFAVLLAFIFHGLFILTGRYRLSYDAYTHMLFADHYAKEWFSLWDTRWYTGFEVVSYPPLIHQLIALFVPAIGFDAAYALILWLVTTLYPLGIYVFSRIFTGKTASSYAALASAVMLPVYVTAHVFGQLPFLAATLLALFGAAALAKFLRQGGFHNFLVAVSITATTISAHHATLLVQPFLIFALTNYHFNQLNWKTTLSRIGIFLIFAIPACMIVIWPFWQWGLHQQLQTPIDHLSRHNFFKDPFAFVIFFIPFYFPIGTIIPFLFNKWPRKFIGLQFAFVILFILGLGGTTQLPKLLFGKSWEWLTYDRFAFWGSIFLTPFFGILVVRFREWIKNRVSIKSLPPAFPRTYTPALIFFIFIISAVGSWLTPILFPIQPKSIDMLPIVGFLEAEDHYYWRYLTFGFGDQFVYLNLLTDKATTLDGSYHTARTVPELRQSGIGQIDTAYWTLKGIPAIGPILQVSGDYGVRWGFVNRKEFIPELVENGWIFKTTLENGIQVWENPQFTFKPPITPTVYPFESFSWGIFPMLSLFTTIAFGIQNIFASAGERIIHKAYLFILGVLPLSLGFWYYKKIFEFNHAQVYFTYDHALFFLSDGLAIMAIVLWLATRTYKFSIPNFPLIIKLIFALCSWMTFSLFWSADWRTSLYISAHFWLIFLLILSMIDWNESWHSTIPGFCAGLILQATIGIIEFKNQSTQFLEPLKLEWPGLIGTFTKGASILKLENGNNFLRVYGSFPHPNILAGFILIGVAGATTFIFSKKEINWLPGTLLAIASSLLVVTFSRSAWFGLFVFLLIIFLKIKSLNPKRVWLTFSITIIALALTTLPLRELFLSRSTPSASSTEEFSLVGRVWLAKQALEYIKQKPLIGIGLGSFIIQLAERAGKFNFVEPVHNVPLLVFSELGALGFILIITIIILIIRDFYISKKPNVIVFGALLAGLGTISLFDHYLWSLAPGRMMLGIVLGLWLGQVAKDDK